MGKTSFWAALLWAGILLLCLAACGGIVPSGKTRAIDRLNEESHDSLYRNAEASREAAQRAYDEAGRYRLGKAEAANNLGACAFLDMDFDRAEALFKEVSSLTSNELERLIADIGLMKVCQRTARNKEYYDFRNRALRRISRISEDMPVFVEEHERRRLRYAFSEFHIVSAVYHYYLQQHAEAVEALEKVDLDELREQDAAQQLHYRYVKGMAGLCGAEDWPSQVLCRFDNLDMCLRMARKEGCGYFVAASLQSLAELLGEKESGAIVRERRPQALAMLGLEDESDTLLPCRLAMQSLEISMQRHDGYQVAGACRVLASWLNMHGRYREALDVLSQALGCVNRHHALHYPLEKGDTLAMYVAQDSLPAELSWINSGRVKTVPEWIAGIREQLSVAYAGMGMKRESDYNRNVYLDILYNIRQDKELESRYWALAEESAQLNFLIHAMGAGVLLAVVLFWFLDRNWKRRNRRDTQRLRELLSICQKVAVSVPVDAKSLDDVARSVREALLPGLKGLLGIKDVQFVLCGDAEGNHPLPGACMAECPLLVPGEERRTGMLRAYADRKLGKEEEAALRVVAPYVAWALENGREMMALGDEERRLDKERYIHEQHLEENKKQNVVKRACLAIVAGIQPLIDRIINETGKLQHAAYAENEEVSRSKCKYIGELAGKINEYNDILALWIKMKQGAMSLNIENFALDGLFKVLAKNRRTFDAKRQTFQVMPTDCIVKADKALTLFMINTLTENARKYTPEGGTVRVYAKEAEDHVEISVEDNGIGLSPHDVSRILNEKVYDSKQIGTDNAAAAGELLQNKGFGFGLMNCKGIIEKYRKTNPLFRVCCFNIESRIGKGSRFYFRLPKGVVKALAVAVLSVAAACTAGHGGMADEPMGILVADSAYDWLLDDAAYFADRAYDSNVEGYYRDAVAYADSAMMCLNEHCRACTGQEGQMSLYRQGNIPEVAWWKGMVDTDYHVILDIRNEAAVAFLALRDWEAYRYNNRAYTALYKLVGEDTSLAEYCAQLRQSASNKTVGIILCVLLLAASLAGYYVFYVRRRSASRRNLEQVLDINRLMLDSSLLHGADDEDYAQVPVRIIRHCAEALCGLLSAEEADIAVPAEGRLGLRPSGGMQWDDDCAACAEECFKRREHVCSPGGEVQCFPLLADAGGARRCVGVFLLRQAAGADREAGLLLSELVAQYIAIVVFNTMVKPIGKRREIEYAEDGMRRTLFEGNQLHVQNMVLDNCLSVIKHETIYYPNRIKQIIDRLNAGEMPEEERRESIKAVGELASYYKDVYTILSACAARQLEETAFRRATVPLQDLFDDARKLLARLMRKSSCRLSLEVEPTSLRVTGDRVELRFLLECLLRDAACHGQDGRLLLSAACEEGFARVSFTDTRRCFSQEELNHFFFPRREQLRMDEGGHLRGVEHLLCKQVVRDHDEHAGRRGCRINAVPCPEGGFTVYFTLPLKTV